jgi:DNA polymerase-3 subunit alpha
MSSLIKPSELFIKAKELEQTSIAVCDHSTLSGAWDCYKYSTEAGVKLIIGCEFNFVEDLSASSEDVRLRHIILLAKNHQGYKNLLALLKKANDNNIIAFKKVFPRIDWKLLEQYQEGLICTTACCSGILGQLINTKKIDQAKIAAKRLKDIFGDDLALEIEPNAVKRIANAYNDYCDQSLTNHQLIKLGEELDIKVIAATNAHYMNKEDYEAQDVLLAIGAGQPVRSGARLKYNNDFYVKSRQEVRDFFARLYKEKADQWCDNTLYFADKCDSPDWIDPKYSNPSGKELPEFPVKDQPDFNQFQNWLLDQPEKIKTSDIDVAYLRFWCENGFSKKVPLDKKEKYRERLEKELDTLQYQGFCSYILIVADYIDYCKKNHIPVGPGRGSCGSSLVGYLTDIHTADPIKYDLIFERFINKERKSYPDIDVDIATSGREHLQEYIRQKYGEDKVAHVSNVNTMTAKVYARDLARAYEFGGDRKSAVAIGTILADSIPDEIKTIENALEEAPLFAAFADKPAYAPLKKYAKHLSGKAKAWSTHAGGIVISKRPLQEFIPLRRDKDGNVAIEYEKERAEANGLVKMDTLGLETLDIIDTSYKLIKLNGKTPPPEVLNYDDCDKDTYDLISKGDTFGVFQFGESRGTVELCKQILPNCMEDLAVITALARPGVPKEFKQQFIEAKCSGEQVELLHPSLKRSLAGTYGIPVFDECMLTLGADVAGWDLNESDRLRKFIKDKGKHPEKDEKLKKDFIASTIENGITPRMANRLWEELFVNFSAYLFNKSHAITYSFISYHTAYLKAHFPLEFLTANLRSEVHSNTKKAAGNIIKFKTEIRKSKVKIIPPDINKSEMSYTIIDNNTLLTGLDSLKFIGNKAIPEILEKRPFTSFEDFLSKVDGRKVTSKSVQALAASGCLDSFGMTRKAMYLYASDYKKKLQVFLKRNKDKTFNYLWSDDIKEWTMPERYAMEIFFIGEGLSGDLISTYPGFFDNKAINFAKLAQFYPKDEPEEESNPSKRGRPKKAKRQESQSISSSVGVVEGVVKDFFEFRVKKEDSKIFGQTMGKLSLEDTFGNSVSVTIFPEKLKDLHSRLKQLGGSKMKLAPGIALHIAASANWYEGEISLLYDELKKCTGQPAMPADLSAKKISMRISGSKKKIDDILKQEEEDIDEFVEEFEDELAEEGLSELDEDGNDQSNIPDAFV